MGPATDWGTVRFIKARTERGARLGVLRPDGVAELAREQDRLEPYFGDDGEALRALADAIHDDPAAESDMDHLALLKPLDPVSMRDFMVFEEHILPSWRRSGMSRGPDVWYEQPIGYFSNAATIRGPRDPIEIPGGSERLDFELEVGAVIGRDAVSVAPADAADRIAGFCILCDWSARDLQVREMDGRLGPFKGKDFGSSLGPVFVTPDELASRRSGNGYDLLMTSTVNGRQYGSDRWSSAYWSFEELISYASWNSRVEAGLDHWQRHLPGRLHPGAFHPAQPGAVPLARPGQRGYPQHRADGRDQGRGEAPGPGPLARPQNCHPPRPRQGPRLAVLSHQPVQAHSGRPARFRHHPGRVMPAAYPWRRFAGGTQQRPGNRPREMDRRPANASVMGEPAGRPSACAVVLA